MPSPFENRFLQSLMSGAGAAIGGEGSLAAFINPTLQQNIGAQSTAAMIAKLLGKGVKFTSDEKGGFKVEGGDVEMLSGLLGGTDPMTPHTAQDPMTPGVVGTGGAAGGVVPAPQFGKPATSAQTFTPEQVMAALNPQRVR